MKKQLFSFLMVLALVVLAGTSAMAQFGTGTAPADPRLISIGATAQFSIANDGTQAVNVNWEVFDATVADATAMGNTLPTAANATTQYNFVTSLTNPAVIDPDQTGLAAAGTSTAYVKWIGTPANGVFVVQATATTSGTNTCVSIRRFYVSIFDFAVRVYLSDADGSNPVSTDKSTCNTWSGRVIANSLATPAVPELELTHITTPHGDYLNNEGGSGVAKFTDTYFRVDIELLTGAPANFGIEDFKWRLRFSTPTFSGMSIWSIRNTVAPNNVYARFSAEGGNAFIGDEGTATSAITALTTSNDWSGTNQNELFFPAATGVTDGTKTGSYVFRVRTHNNLGQADMIYAIQAELAQLEFQATSDYNNGTKVHSSNAGNDPKLVDATDNTGTQTIQQGPATGIIDIVD
jgi:hypothetical protein